jgi:hypothetical protein
LAHETAWRAGRSHARAVDQFVFFLPRAACAVTSFYFLYRAQPARWKSCFTSAAQQLRGAEF